ncbi:MAG TPA: tripartite tricarboxylate transporter substrate-binding protein [Beijerinckiaceae bacterium]|nr:tripartite tricarboxylate transporter substrate-binding protein [Beijerinckiaceae bacterium]
MTIDRRSFLTGAAAAGAALTGAGSQALAQAAPNFAGRTIEWVIPFAEGGGSDVWARFFAPYLSKYLPGKPNVIIRNVPGGGSITGTNEFVARARPDGLSFIGTSGSTQFPYLLGDPRVRYEYRDLIPVIVSPTGGVAYLPAKFGVKDASELGKVKGQELVYASQGATSLDLVPMLAFEVLGLKVRHVFGMRGRGEGRLALERGEATIDYQTSSAYLTQVVPMVQKGDVVPLFSWGVFDDAGNVARDPTFPDLPHFVEAYQMMHGKKPEGTAFNAYLAFFGSGFAAQKPAMLQKGTPQNIVAAYRKAFADAVADPELQAKKEDVLGDYKQATGPEIEQLYKVATTIDPDARAWVRKYLQDNHNVKF